MTYAQEAFHTALTTMIEASHTMRRELGDLSAEMGRITYAKAFCTVRVAPGRMMGKTEYIRRFSTSDDAVIFFNKGMARVLGEGCGGEKFSIRENGKIRGKSFKTIYVDEASLCFSEISADDLYRAVSAVDQTTFVFLG